MAYQKLLPGLQGNCELVLPKKALAWTFPLDCVWCGNPARTSDHLIPQWYSRKFQQRHRPTHQWLFAEYPSCQSCNSRKGPLPPAEFKRLRGDVKHIPRSNKLWRAATIQWLDIAAYFGKTRHKSIPAELMDHVDTAMREPVDFYMPEEVRKAWRLLYAVREDRRQTIAAAQERKTLKLLVGESDPKLAEVWPAKP